MGGAGVRNDGAGPSGAGAVLGGVAGVPRPAGQRPRPLHRLRLH